MWLSFLRREDRRARAQRRRQEHAAAHHGRRRPRLRRRGQARGGRPRRLPRRSRSSIRTKTVREKVERGPGRQRALTARFDGDRRKLGEPMDAEEMEKLLEEQGRCRTTSTPPTPGRSTARSRSRWTPCAPPRRRHVATLSGGERRRVALCRLLLSSPTCCCSTSPPTTSTPSRWPGWSGTQEYPGTVVAVTHDRYFLDNVAGWILELDRGAGIPWKGNYTGWLEQKEKRLALEEKGESRAGAPCSASSSGCAWPAGAPGQEQGPPGRVRGCAEAGQEDSAGAGRDHHSRGAAARRTGRRGESLRKGYGDRLLFDDLDFTLPRGGIVGVIGAERRRQDHALPHDHRPGDAGRRRAPRRRDVAARLRRPVAASRCTPRTNVWQEISRRQDEIHGRQARGRLPRLRGLVQLQGPDQQKKVGDLSGGERNRVHLAKLLKQRRQPAAARRAHQRPRRRHPARARGRAVAFAGCAVVISHDRWFLDRIATHILAFEGDSRVVWFEGNYQEYEADRRKRLGADADQPHRIKYRRLTH